MYFDFVFHIIYSLLGYLVRALAHQPDRFHKCTHLIIDEVHERSVDGDLVCLLARDLLRWVTNVKLTIQLSYCCVCSELFLFFYCVFLFLLLTWFFLLVCAGSIPPFEWFSWVPPSTLLSTVITSPPGTTVPTATWSASRLVCDAFPWPSSTPRTWKSLARRSMEMVIAIRVARPEKKRLVVRWV